MSARSGEFLGCLNLRDVITWPILCMWRDVPPREVGGDQVGWDGMGWHEMEQYSFNSSDRGVW